ncbi:dUTP diphosphatase [Paenibacillus tundrae]|uniref:dUTP diphosphatase n=1 Tax=Paenibacillus tundrae TaxID=528187 RepID=UPI0027D77AB1|nr:dUTP diphosphatase [Paenibacillus tundrae]
MIVKFKRLHPDAMIPQYATEMAAGFDLVAVEDVIIAPGETAKVPLGFAVQIPPGYEIQIRPRSGVTFKTKLRVANSPGTVDADYRGEVAVLVDNVAQKSYDIITDEVYAEATFCFSLVDGNMTLDEPEGCDTSDAIIKDTYWIRKGDRITQGVLSPVLRASFEEVADLDVTERGDGGFGHTGVSE